MSEKNPIGSRFWELALDVFHRWSGELLKKPDAQPVALSGVVSVSKQHLVSITTLLDPAVADELTKLAQVMQTTESDVLARLIKIAKMIREFGLYGVPTPDGNQLGIYVRRTNEVHKIHLECPAQQKHSPPDSPAPPGGNKPPSHLN